jgi:hypothetical protein
MSRFILLPTTLFFFLTPSNVYGSPVPNFEIYINPCPASAPTPISSQPLIPTISDVTLSRTLEFNSEVQEYHNTLPISLGSQFPSYATDVTLILEDRPGPNLVPLLLHYASVLGPTWPIVVLTSTSFRTSSLEFLRLIRNRRIIVEMIPPGVSTSNLFDLGLFGKALDMGTTCTC